MKGWGNGGLKTGQYMSDDEARQFWEMMALGMPDGAEIIRKFLEGRGAQTCRWQTIDTCTLVAIASGSFKLGVSSVAPANDSAGTPPVAPSTGGSETPGDELRASPPA